MFVSCSRRRLTPLCTFGSKTADRLRPAQTDSHADFFHLFHKFSLILPPFPALLCTYISLRHISRLSKYDYNRRILSELTSQTMASQAETCEARLSEGSLPPAPSLPPSPRPTLSTSWIARRVLGCASTGLGRLLVVLGWSKAQSGLATAPSETQRSPEHGVGRGALGAVTCKACSSEELSLNCCCWCSSR